MHAIDWRGIMKKWILIALALASLPACSNKASELKSPCVGDEGSPCARRSVNDRWAQG
jgi:hypothetical protein